MIDHISLRVTDLERALAFYKAALAPLGYVVLAEYPGVAGMGVPGGQADFWVTKTDKAINEAHVGFAGTRAQVDAFYQAALAAGGQDNGAPGPREMYSPSYYGGFVLDLDGNNIEVCSHESAVKTRARAAVKAVKKVVGRVKARVKAKAKAAAGKAKKPAGKAKAAAKAKPAAGKAKKPPASKKAAGKKKR